MKFKVKSWGKVSRTPTWPGRTAQAHGSPKLGATLDPYQFGR